MVEISSRLKSCVLFYNDIGCEDESATDAEQLEKILFYHPADESATVRLNHVSLCEGLIAFARSFGNPTPSGGSDESLGAVETVHMQNHRYAFLQVEPAVWLIAMLTEDHDQGQGLLDDTAVLSMLRQLYETITLFQGPLRAFFTKSIAVGVVSPATTPFLETTMPDNPSKRQEGEEGTGSMPGSMTGLEVVLRIQRLRKLLRKLHALPEDHYRALPPEDQAAALATDAKTALALESEYDLLLPHSPSERIRSEVGDLLRSSLLPFLDWGKADCAYDLSGFPFLSVEGSTFLCARVVAAALTPLKATPASSPTPSPLNAPPPLTGGSEEDDRRGRSRASVEGCIVLIDGQVLYSDSLEGPFCGRGAAASLLLCRHLRRTLQAPLRSQQHYRSNHRQEGQEERAQQCRENAHQQQPPPQRQSQKMSTSSSSSSSSSPSLSLRHSMRAQFGLGPSSPRQQAAPPQHPSSSSSSSNSSGDSGGNGGGFYGSGLSLVDFSGHVQTLDDGEDDGDQGGDDKDENEVASSSPSWSSSSAHFDCHCGGALSPSPSPSSASRPREWLPVLRSTSSPPSSSPRLHVWAPPLFPPRKCRPQTPTTPSSSSDGAMGSRESNANSNTVPALLTHDDGDGSDDNRLDALYNLGYLAAATASASEDEDGEEDEEYEGDVGDGTILAAAAEAAAAIAAAASVKENHGSVDGEGEEEQNWWAQDRPSSSRLLVYSQGRCTVLLVVNTGLDGDDKSRVPKESRRQHPLSLSEAALLGASTSPPTATPATVTVTPAAAASLIGRRIKRLCAQSQRLLEPAVAKLLDKLAALRGGGNLTNHALKGARFLYFNGASLSTMAVMSTADFGSASASSSPSSSSSSGSSNGTNSSNSKSTPSPSSSPPQPSPPSFVRWTDAASEFAQRISPSALRAVNDMHTSFNTGVSGGSSSTLQAIRINPSAAEAAAAAAAAAAVGQGRLAVGSLQELQQQQPQNRHEWVVGERFGEREVYMCLDGRFSTIADALGEVARLKGSITASIVLP